MKFILIAVLATMSVSRAEETQSLTDYSKGYVHFTANVYKELLKSKSGSFVMSPLSAHTILSLATTGARGKTAQELTSALQLPKDFEEVYEAVKTLRSKLTDNEGYTFNVVNKIYAGESFEISEQFKNVSVDVFGSEIETISFKDAEKAATQINHWVEQKTLNKIKDLISPSYINDLTASVLVNAVIFKASWWKLFGLTTKQVFKLNSQKEIETNMMARTGFYGYYESSELNAKILKMTYKAPDVEMYIVLPNEVEGLVTLEEKLSAALVPTNVPHATVEVRVPEFNIETDINFKNILKSMGVQTAFDDTADFSGMTTNKAAMKISEVVQKTTINVDRKGTTAASATGVVFEYLSGEVLGPERKVFHADHPFLFYLHFKPLGINMFVGRYTGA